jgi:hypothetical protein
MRRRAWNFGIAAAFGVFLWVEGAFAQAQPALPPLGGAPPPPQANAPGAKPLPPLPDAPPAPPAPAPPPAAPGPDVTILPPLPPSAPEPTPLPPSGASIPLSTPAPAPVTPAPERLAPSEAAPEPLRPHGFSFGLRLDVAFPFGSINSPSGTTDLSEGTAGGFSDYFGMLISFTADLGYRLTPHWYIGGYFAAGPTTSPFGSANNCTDSSQCSLNDIRFGFDAKYLGSPSAFVDPWIGAGFGWEIANQSTVDSAGASYGPEFLHVRAGLDFRLSRHLFVGPEAMFAMGVFTNGLGVNATSGVDFSAALHEWLSIGASGHWDL